MDRWARVDAGGAHWRRTPANPRAARSAKAAPAWGAKTRHRIVAVVGGVSRKTRLTRNPRPVAAWQGSLVFVLALPLARFGSALVIALVFPRQSVLSGADAWPHTGDRLPPLPLLKRR